MFGSYSRGLFWRIPKSRRHMSKLVVTSDCTEGSCGILSAQNFYESDIKFPDMLLQVFPRPEFHIKIHAMVLCCVDKFLSHLINSNLSACVKVFT